MFEIHRHRGVGPIVFGMSRKNVVGAMGEAPERGTRGVHDTWGYDYFPAIACFVYYGADPSKTKAGDECVVAVELASPARVSFEGFDLFAHPASDACEWARKLDPTLECADGFISRFLGLSMYAPLIDESDLNEDEARRPGESFMVFKPGYYEEELARASTTPEPLHQLPPRAGSKAER